MPLNSYKDLIVWQKAYELVKVVYKITSRLPQSEIYALQSQARRAAVSVVSNIAEGYNRKTKKDYAQFLHISHGSTSELETQLFICRDLYQLEVSEALQLINEVGKMLGSLMNKLEPRP